MRTTLFLSAAVAMAACLAANAGTAKLLDFEGETFSACNYFLNCKAEVVSAEAGEKAPDGRKRYLKVTMGGSGAKGGGVSFPLPKDKIPDSADSICIWIKGSSANEYGPVATFGGWCWMGLRHDAKAQLPVDEEEWVKVMLKVEDFVPATSSAPATPKQLNKNDYFVITLGAAKDYPQPIVFCIGGIEVTSGDGK